jgi:hypothetical protein
MIATSPNTRGNDARSLYKAWLDRGLAFQWFSLHAARLSQFDRVDRSHNAGMDRRRAARRGHGER